MASLPPVAVVVPVWNRPGLVVRALEGVRAQTRPPDEVLVVDDGSTDGTAAAVETWIGPPGRRPPFRLLRRPNRGAAAARNEGLAQVPDAEFVAFLDSDDLWPPDFLARAVDALERRPEAVAASADRLREDLRARRRTFDDLASFAADPVRWVFRHGGGLGSCTVFRAAVVRAAGGYPEDLPTGHDCVLFCRVASRGPWLHCPGAPVGFLRHHATVTHEADHLSTRVPDAVVTWARAFEGLAREVGPARLPPAARRSALARRWAHAGTWLASQRRRRDARACFARALRHRPLRADAWLGLLRALWPGGPSA